MHCARSATCLQPFLKQMSILQNSIKKYILQAAQSIITACMINLTCRMIQWSNRTFAAHHSHGKKLPCWEQGRNGFLPRLSKPRTEWQNNIIYAFMFCPHLNLCSIGFLNNMRTLLRLWRNQWADLLNMRPLIVILTPATIWSWISPLRGVPSLGTKYW